MKVVVQWFDGLETRTAEVNPPSELHYYPNTVIFTEKGTRTQYKINRRYFISEAVIND